MTPTGVLQLSERRREKGSTVNFFNGSRVDFEKKNKKIIIVTRLDHGTKLLILKLKRRGG